MNKIDLIIAEIERRIAAYQKNFDKADNKIAKLSTDGRIASLKELLPFINSLPEDEPSSWKPSEEQMKTLKCLPETLRHFKLDTSAQMIEVLYEQLKKL